LRFGRGGERAEERAERRREDREERQRSGTPADVSPLAFWRRGRARTFRDQPESRQTLGGTLRRLRGMYFPPWVPVVFIILVVFGILGLLFYTRSATGAPRINDHWHATYQVFVCGQRKPNFPVWEAGVHTHADGVIHIHPFVPSEEGAGARLVKWFEYGGGKLTQTEMQMPGTPKDQVYKNGEKSKDGCEGVLQVFVNGQKMDNWSRYIPQDGDRVRIVFGPEESQPTQLDDRTVIDPKDAQREVSLEVTGGEADAAFKPASIELRPGETVKITLKNTGSISHEVRIAGADGEYETSDDFVSTTADGSDIIKPGEEGFLVVRLDDEGEYQFQDPTSTAAQGTITVRGEPVTETPTATPSPGAQEPVDVTLDVVANDAGFEPGTLEVPAGKKFRINIKNEGEFVHSMRIAGPDGQYDTEDDLASKQTSIKAGETGELVGQIEEPGEYTFRCDFHRTEETGTLTVK
jgi:plastocyanin